MTENAVNIYCRNLRFIMYCPRKIMNYNVFDIKIRGDSFMKTKVLIIKHDTKAATELRQQLAKNKDICVCDIISDGGNAVSAIRAQNPNVILLDFLLPNLDGLAVMEEVNGWGTRGYRFLLQGNASQIRFAQNTCRGNVDSYFRPFYR